MRYLVLLPLVLFSLQALANSEALIWGDSYGLANFERDFDDDSKPWQEIQAKLPPAPKSDKLIEVKLDASTRNRLLIDTAALSVGDDGVVRYTAVIRSPSGAETINFEGMRCTTGERKLYAFGHPNGEWSRNRRANWEPIQARQAGGYHRELFFHYLCTVGARSNVPTLLRILKSGGVYEQ